MNGFFLIAYWLIEGKRSLNRGIHPMRNVRISLIFLSSFALLFGVWPASKSAAPIKALRFGKLIEGAGKSITNAVVVIENDRIRSVSSDGSSIPPGVEELI